MAVRKIERGHYFEDFEVGHLFKHHWGRTITEGDNSFFSSVTMNFNPSYFNREYAQSLGYKNVVVNHMLVMNVVFGLSVEDLSEAGGLFLGVDKLTFHRRIHPGDTLVARSTVEDKRESQSRPESGIVTWHTEGFLADGDRGLVVDFRRSNLIPKRV